MIQDDTQVAEFLNIVVELYTQNSAKHDKFLPFLEQYESKILRQDSQAYTECLQLFISRVVRHKTYAKVLRFAMTKNARSIIFDELKRNYPAL